MHANDWHKAATHLAPECVIDWPCSGERIVGRSDSANIQARYPINTGRRFVSARSGSGRIHRRGARRTEGRARGAGGRVFRTDSDRLVRAARVITLPEERQPAGTQRRAADLIQLDR
jgi:hypothetical protein